MTDELSADDVAAMYSSFTRNEIVDSKYGMMDLSESLIGGIKEMSATFGVTRSAKFPDDSRYFQFDTSKMTFAYFINCRAIAV